MPAIGEPRVFNRVRTQRLENVPRVWGPYCERVRRPFTVGNPIPAEKRDPVFVFMQHYSVTCGELEQLT